MRKEAAQPAHAFQLLNLVPDALLELTIPGTQLGGLIFDRVVVPLDPDEGAHPGQQFGLVERLVDEVVGAGLDGADLLLAATGGDHDHRQESRLRIFADSAADLIAIHSGHQDVEQHEIRVLLAQDVQGFLSGRRRGHPESLRRQHRLKEADVFAADRPRRVRADPVSLGPHLLAWEEPANLIGKGADTDRLLHVPVAPCPEKRYQ